MQLQANTAKQEALNAEIEVANSIYGESSEKAEQLQRQLNYVEAQGNSLEAQLSECTSALESQTSAMGELESTIASQEKELDALKEQYASIVLESGKWSDDAKALKDGFGAVAF